MNDLSGSGSATIKVTFNGIEADVDNNSINDKSSSLNNTNFDPIEIPLSKELSIYAALEESNIHETSTKSILNNKKIAAKELSQITTGTKYSILVYDGDILIGENEFTAGQETNFSGFELDGGKTYTFIGISNNTNTLPTLINKNYLSTASVNEESGDLLYFRHVQKVVTGNNNLKVTLRHKYTLITTRLKVGDLYAGKIQSVGQGTFTNVNTNASLKLSDSTITYSSSKTSQQITFGNISGAGIALINSNPNILIAPNSSNQVKYTIPNLTVNDITYNQIQDIDLTIRPGKKYNLVLTLDVPCVKNNTPTTFNIANGTSVTLNNILGNYGMIFDIDNIDDSFNININGTNLFEADFNIASRTGTQTRTRKVTGTALQLYLTNYSTTTPNWNNTSLVFFSNIVTQSAIQDATYGKWSSLPFGSYSWLRDQKADLAFNYNGQGGYVNAMFTNYPDWRWTWSTTNNTDYIYDINDNISNPTVPAIRVIVSNNNQITLLARKGKVDQTLYPISLQTNPTLTSDQFSQEDLTVVPNNFYLKSSSINLSSTPSYSAIVTSVPNTSSNLFYDLAVPYTVNGVTYTNAIGRTVNIDYIETQSRTVNQTIANQIIFKQNPIIWNTTGTNNIVLGQLVVGNTNARGTIYTRAKINCNTN